jgi:16S rRNA (cytosine967-C5)-methyltransferase
MIAPARSAAFQILLAVTSVDMHSDELLRSPEVDALAIQDRALTTTLVLGTLRWQIKLDAQIRALLARPDTKLTPPVETALRLGAYQLLHLDRIPAYAAIGESVELAKQAGETFAAGMVNAILRKIARLPRPSPAAAPGNPARLAEAYAHPAWMVARWVRAYGLSAAAAICEFDQEPAAVFVRLLDPEVEQSLSDEGVELAPGEFLTAARRVVSGDIVRSAAFRSGRVRIQEEGSQLVAELAGLGSRILDTCAAPGGKTAILAERNPEATITAWDVSRKRLDAMRRQFASAPASAGERIRFEVRDAAATKPQPEYDLILCDVPCTGTGTIGRNPEIRFRINESGITRQHERQVKILSAALAGLAPEGRLLYSTCSLEPEENEAVVAECLAANPQFALRPLEEEITRLSAEGIVSAEGAERLQTTAFVNGCLRTIPGVHGCDGFFAASLVRKS